MGLKAHMAYLGAGFTGADLSECLTTWLGWDGFYKCGIDVSLSDAF